MKRMLYSNLEVEICERSAETGLWLPEPRHPETLEFLHQHLLRIESPVMLDIGAGQGRYSLLARFTPKMKVFAWEPHPILYEMLTENLALNRLKTRTKTFNCGLWKHSGEMILYTHTQIRRGRSSTMGDHPHKKAWNRSKVEIKKLDDFQPLFKKVDLIKLDVEGAEWFVLRGGRKTIKKRLPPIFMEWMENTTDMFGYKLKQMEDHLRSWGYRNFAPVPPYDMWVTA